MLVVRLIERHAVKARVRSTSARDKLLVFLTRRDVEPTNNESERAQALGDLAQGHELLAIDMGRESLRRPLLHRRNRAHQRTLRSPRNPRHPHPGMTRHTAGVSSYHE